MKRPKNIIILCVDRDDDVGVKAGVKGPIIGKQNVIDAATKLSLADPEDSDSNALFGAVKTYEEVRKKYNAEVAVLTGHKNEGLEADQKIAEQLNIVLKKHPSDQALFVTDGVGDEHMIPIIQSKLPIMSVNRIIVKQSENLESTYYKIEDFIKDSLEDPKVSALVFGLPAIAFILYALLGATGWRIILGAVGAFLLMKGFKIDDYFMNSARGLSHSFGKSSLEIFSYMLSIALIIIALVRSYNYVIDYEGIFEMMAAFVSSAIFILWIAASVAWIGHRLSKKSTFGSIVSVPIFGLAVAVVLYAAAYMILVPQMEFTSFITYIILGFVMLLIALLIERKS
jgi:putative membrane protein